MRALSVVIPIVGIVFMAGVPLWRYAERERNERGAIDALHAVHAAQRAYRAAGSGYATDIAALSAPCGGVAPLAGDVLERLAAFGYTVRLRAAEGARATGSDCQGRGTSSDYYLAASPVSAHTAARQAFAGRADGRLYLFVDGIAPREADMDGGLATPVELRESFRIP
jgi:type II secretory pathway pseudopilin PulG